LVVVIALESVVGEFTCAPGWLLFNCLRAE